MQTMTRRISLHFLLFIVVFIGCWTILGQVDWMQQFNLNKLSAESEEKLGDLYIKYFINTQAEITDPAVFVPVDSLLQTICAANEIAPENIKLHILANSEVNAFALPDGHMVVYSGLIAASQNEAELSGIIAHELAHINEKHVMQKLRRELGLAVLLSMTTGNGSETVRNTARLFTSSAYDRDLEREADRKAIDYVIRARLSPASLADFLERLAEKEHTAMRHLEWINTHPDTRKRVQFIRTYSKEKSGSAHTILDEATWRKLQQRLAAP